jgi:hypothetical protein
MEMTDTVRVMLEEIKHDLAEGGLVLIHGISGNTATEGIPEAAVQRLEINQSAKNIKTDQFEITHTILPMLGFISMIGFLL